MSTPSRPFSLDIVIPVYNAPDDVRRCIDSVLRHAHDDCRITLIDDASPDPAIAKLFEEIEARDLPDVLLLRNEQNLGFTGTANRGMRNSEADVVLLNSDAVVTRGWQEALRRCAASDPRIGTITPFSNNAEICSFPRFCVDNGVPESSEAESIAVSIAAAAVPSYPDLPTGVGFCLYVRRPMIDDVGVFDPAFGAGYGEENDLCLRAARNGWRNVLADDAYVVHAGGRSFAGQKEILSPRNTALLLARHPHYTGMVESYIAADPLLAIREAAQTLRSSEAAPARGVLHVIHDHGGGTEVHVRALIEASRERWRHYLAIAVGDTWQIEEHRADGHIVTFDLMRGADESWEAFVGGVCATFRITLIHLHNISACRDGLCEALATLGVPYGYTVHDLNFACPTITFLGFDEMFCGGQTNPEVCGACLAAQPPFRDVNIVTWRARHDALLARAAFLIAPSRWTAAMLDRYFPGRSVHVIEHGTPDEVLSTRRVASQLSVPDDGVPIIAVLGAIGPDKGARRLERLVALARERHASVRFVLIGYLDVQQIPWQSEDLRFTVHGHYERADLAGLLEHYRVALVLYPSAGPETFSYTLSEAWAAGRPVLVPPIGALEERVRGGGAGFVMSEAEWRDESLMLDRIEALVAPQAREFLAAAGEKARAHAHATLSEMADATFAVYDEALARAPNGVRVETFPRTRIRDALGYVAWTPPSLELPVSSDRLPAAVAADSMPDFATRAARAALSIRQTPIGRVLYRMTPRPLLDALKARLRT